MLFGPLECRFADLASCWSGDDANRDRQIGSGDSGERLEFRMGRERGAHLFRRIGPFHAGVQPFRILAEHDCIDERFLKASLGALAHKVQRISAWMYSASKPTASSARNACGRTWLPIPSPGMVTTVYFGMSQSPGCTSSGFSCFRPNFLATMFSAPPAITSDWGTVPKGGN